MLANCSVENVSAHHLSLLRLAAAAMRRRRCLTSLFLFFSAGHYFADSSKLPNSVSIGVIVLFCFFISSFAWSWGPLGWLVPSEIHPLETRSAGQGINVAVNL